MIFEEVINALGATFRIGNKYQYTYTQGRKEITKIGTLVSLKPKFLVFQLEDYKDTINVSDILNKQVKISLLDNEENIDIPEFIQSKGIEEGSMTKDQIKNQIENDLQNNHNPQEEGSHNPQEEGNPQNHEYTQDSKRPRKQSSMVTPPGYDELLEAYNEYRSFEKVGKHFGVSAYVATTWLIKAGIAESQDARFKKIPRPKNKPLFVPERKVKQAENDEIPPQSIQQENKEETIKTSKPEGGLPQFSIETLKAICEDNQLIPLELSNMLASSDDSIWEKIFLMLIGVLLIKNAFDK